MFYSLLSSLKARWYLITNRYIEVNTQKNSSIPGYYNVTHYIIDTKDGSIVAMYEVKRILS